jgi:cytochrome P450
MTYPAPISGQLDISATAFWGRSPRQRHAAYAEMRAMPAPPFFAAPESPIPVNDDRGYYALVRHADVAEASRHPELFSSASGATSIADLPTEFNEYFGSMINMDDPRHARLRRIVSRAFTPRMIRKFNDDVERAAAAIVTDLLATGPCDYVQQVSARLPLKIICDMMGIGDEHYEMVLRNTNIILSGADPEFISGNADEAVTQILTAGGDLAALVTSLAERRTQNSAENSTESSAENSTADDLVTALATANIDGEKLTPAELASFFILLVVAGNETTRNAISHALVLLTEHPEQRALLLEDLDTRIGPAVEEIVRYVSPVIWMRRTLTADTVMNDHAYQAGDKFILVYQSANRDPSVFPDADRFDITRAPNPHVGFGAAGPHFCLGAHLARREITAVLRELLTRVPDIRAAGEPDYLLSSFINGIKHLPCEFG